MQKHITDVLKHIGRWMSMSKFLSLILMNLMLFMCSLAKNDLKRAYELSPEDAGIKAEMILLKVLKLSILWFINFSL